MDWKKKVKQVLELSSNYANYTYLHTHGQGQQAKGILQSTSTFLQTDAFMKHIYDRRCASFENGNPKKRLG